MKYIYIIMLCISLFVFNSENLFNYKTGLFSKLKIYNKGNEHFLNDLSNFDILD
jgi:hypothetical protein